MGKVHKYGIEIFQLCEANVALYRTLGHKLVHILTTQHSTPHLLLLADCVSTWRTRGIPSTWTDGFLAWNSSVTCGNVRQRL